MAGRIHVYLPAGVGQNGSVTIEISIALARALEAEVGVSIPRLSATAPAHWLASEYLMTSAAELNLRSAEEAARLSAEVDKAARAADVPTRILDSVSSLVGADRQAVMTARTYDLTMVGLADGDRSMQQQIEEFLFESGRPVLLAPLSRQVSVRLKTAMVAWDHTEPAARALIGALPLLRHSERVHVVTMRGAKRLPKGADAREAAAYLQAHGLDAKSEIIEVDESSAGTFLMQAAVAREAGLLVMGAYSTLRAREYLLGGVTRGVLDAPLLPVLMAN